MRPVQDLQHATHCGVVSHLQLDSGSHAWRDANSYIWCDPIKATPRNILNFWNLGKVFGGFSYDFGGQLEHGTCQPNLLALRWSSKRSGITCVGLLIWLEKTKTKCTGFFYISNLKQISEKDEPSFFHKIWLGVENYLSVHVTWDTLKHKHTSPNCFSFRLTLSDQMLCYMLWSLCSWPLQQQPTPHTHVHTHTHNWK